MNNFRVPTHVHTTFFPEKAVLLDSKKNVYYALNDSASEFWKNLIQMGSFEEALQEVLKLYQDSSEVLRKDMEKLVNSLLHVGLLERAETKKAM